MSSNVAKAQRKSEVEPYDVADDVGREAKAKVKLRVCHPYSLQKLSRRDKLTVPLIAVTGYDQPADHAASREAEFDQHFAKPVSAVELASTLSQIAAEKNLSSALFISLPQPFLSLDVA